MAQWEVGMVVSGVTVAVRKIQAPSENDAREWAERFLPTSSKIAKTEKTWFSVKPVEEKE